MSTVATYSYTHSVTYVTDNILKSLKDIILLSGLDPEHFADRWESNTRAIKTWLGTGDLRKVILEIYNPATDKLVTRWDIDWAAAGLVDTDLSFLSLLELYGTEISERRMPTRRVVEALDVVEHI